MKAYQAAVLLLWVPSLGVMAGDWEFGYHLANVTYAVYGNSLGDPTSPSKGNDKKIAFAVQGQAAREMFEAIGLRSRDDERLVCTKSRAGQYACYFGFDLKSGKSIGGSIC